MQFQSLVPQVASSVCSVSRQASTMFSAAHSNVEAGAVDEVVVLWAATSRAAARGRSRADFIFACCAVW